MDNGFLRERIRHFLLGISHIQDHIKNESTSYSKIHKSKIARDLHKLCPDISARKFEKYLSEFCPPKGLSITFSDILALSKLSGKDSGSFVNYLLLEECDDDRMTPLEKKMLLAVRQLKSSQRRALSACLDESAVKFPDFIDLILQIKSVDQRTLSIISAASRGICEEMERSRGREKL